MGGGLSDGGIPSPASEAAEGRSSQGTGSRFGSGRLTSSNRENMSPSLSETSTPRNAANSETPTLWPRHSRAPAAYLSRSFSSFSGFRLKRERKGRFP